MKYDPLIAPDPKKWLKTDEEERIQSVLDYHTRMGIKLPNEYLHAVVHTIVENQAALGDETPVEQALRRLMGEKLDRHEAIHAVGSVLAEYIMKAMEGGDWEKANFNADYYEEVRQLTAKKWMERYGNDMD